MTPIYLTIATILGLLMGLIYLALGPAPGKTMAIAQAAYRESIRQPLFWVLLLASMFFMFLAVFIPYFTLGEDLKMMKDLQLDAILLPCLILTIVTAALSIAEEIEGRTAITLLSKPIARWQFILGKFLGILLSALLLAVILTIFLGFTINFKINYEGLEDLPGPRHLVEEVQGVTRGLPLVALAPAEYVLNVFVSIYAMAPGPLLIFCQVTILTAVAVALATRLPLVLNLVVCFGVFFAGRVTAVLETQAGGNTLVMFFAQLFGFALPQLGYYDVGQTLAQGINDVPWSYIGQAWFHGLIYTTMALLFGLVLFEDRDLA
jgi:hypothetical protein